MTHDPRDEHRMPIGTLGLRTRRALDWRFDPMCDANDATNDPSPATRRTGRTEGIRDAPAGRCSAWLATVSSYCLRSLMSALKLLPIAEDRNATPAEKYLQALAVVPKLEAVLRRSRLGAKLERLLGKHPKVCAFRFDANSLRLLAPVRDGHGVCHKVVEWPNVAAQ